MKSSRSVVVFSSLILLAVSAFSKAEKTNSLVRALDLARGGNYQQATPLLWSLSRDKNYKSERAQIQYALGTSLMQLNLNQVAAFQFIDVIRSGNRKYLRLAIEKLSLAADVLGDDTLLNYAISKVNVEDFPAKYKDLISYRLGEVRLRNGAYLPAAQLFEKVNPESSYKDKAMYLTGLAYLQAQEPNQAARVFKKLVSSYSHLPIPHPNRVSAQIGLARALYQSKQWDESIAAYREVPRDSIQWHDALFESSWAMLRGARFRSALSNFHSLHSSYYDEFYNPESLLLRGILYLYICKYDEMGKTLDLFERTYGPIRKSIRGVQSKNSKWFFDMISKSQSQLPTQVIHQLRNEGDVRRALVYLDQLHKERSRAQQLGSSHFFQYAQRLLFNRIKNAEENIGEMAKSHLQDLVAQLNEHFEQAGFIRYEMINGKKEEVKKRLAGKYVDTGALDEDVDRTFYVQNGYEYWPFNGEYWLDEIGNYQYLGRQSCK